MSKPKKAAAPIAEAIVSTPARVIPMLMWSGDLLCGGKAVSFAKAEEAVKKLDLGGHTDWRLPTLDELLSIVDRSTYSPAIDTKLFPGTPSGFHWSSTPYALLPADCAWGVYFFNGYADALHRSSSHGFVRAVRSVAPASPGQ